MSKFDLRDISARLTKSRDVQAVVYEFLHCLEATRPDWRASIAFYDSDTDGFADVFETEGERVVRRHIVVRANELPDRLVRKLFDASAIFNAKEKRSLFSGGLGSAPCFVADERDASELMPLTVIAGIVRNVRAVFPHVQLWFGSPHDVMVLASPAPFRDDTAWRAARAVFAGNVVED